VLKAIGWVESPLSSLDQAPLQGDEGAPDAAVVFEPVAREALDGLQVGADVLVITWLDRANRDVLVVHPPGDPGRPISGVFNIRSPDDPIRSVCTQSPSCRSTAYGYLSATWKRWTELQSWT
jgi:tRNA (Thr-GGU) A37 N-methylase